MALVQSFLFCCCCFRLYPEALLAAGLRLSLYLSQTGSVTPAAEGFPSAPAPLRVVLWLPSFVDAARTCSLFVVTISWLRLAFLALRLARRRRIWSFLGRLLQDAAQRRRTIQAAFAAYLPGRRGAPRRPRPHSRTAFLVTWLRVTRRLVRYRHLRRLWAHYGNHLQTIKRQGRLGSATEQGRSQGSASSQTPPTPALSQPAAASSQPTEPLSEEESFYEPSEGSDADWELIE